MPENNNVKDINNSIINNNHDDRHYFKESYFKNDDDKVPSTHKTIDQLTIMNVGQHRTYNNYN